MYFVELFDFDVNKVKFFCLLKDYYRIGKDKFDGIFYIIIYFFDLLS